MYLSSHDRDAEIGRQLAWIWTRCLRFVALLGLLAAVAAAGESFLHHSDQPPSPALSQTHSFGGDLQPIGHDAPPEPSTSPRRVLRVMADPNNLPFSNARLEGFENKLIAVVAAELNATVEYTWAEPAISRPGLRQTDGDLIAGVPSGSEHGLTTRPYCEQRYVFVTRSDQELNVSRLDDDRLQTLRIGLGLSGAPLADQPLLSALTERGLIENVQRYRVHGHDAHQPPLTQIVDAVARGEIDVALMSSPLAAYYLARYRGVFRAEVVERLHTSAPLPLNWDVCLAVRPTDTQLRDEIDEALLRRSGEIRAILAAYGVPQTRG